MAKRVEICGIDTGSLPKLNHSETMELLRKAQKGDEKAKEDFILANMRLVLSIVQRFYNKKESVDDIFQVGCIGLIKAMEKSISSHSHEQSGTAIPWYRAAH